MQGTELSCPEVYFIGDLAVTRKSTGIGGRWQIFPEREVLVTPIVTIKSGPLQSSITEKRKDFYFFDFPDWVNVIALTPQREILLIRQFRYGTKRLELEIPGGMIDKGEQPVEAGCRELLEETGFAGENPRLIGRVSPNPAIQGNYCYTVLLDNAVQVASPSPDDMEDIEWMCVPEQEIQSYIGSGQIEHGLVLNALAHYQRFTTAGGSGS